MANTNAKKKKKINSFSIIKIVLCSCLVLLIVGAITKEASEYSAKKKEKAQLESQLSDQNAENQAKEDQIENGDIDELIEEQARENGYIMPDEQVIIDITPDA